MTFISYNPALHFAEASSFQSGVLRSRVGKEMNALAMPADKVWLSLVTLSVLHPTSHFSLRRYTAIPRIIINLKKIMLSREYLYSSFSLLWKVWQAHCNNLFFAKDNDKFKTWFILDRRVRLLFDISIDELHESSFCSLIFIGLPSL